MQSITETGAFGLLRRLFAAASRQAGERVRQLPAHRADPRSAISVQTRVRALERAWQRNVSPAVCLDPYRRDLP